MTNLNLTANGKPQELILAYLQENVSDVLAEKINNGVYIEKDGKRLLSKKDLDGFMRFASDEAKKLAEKNARSACVEDNIVYGWAIHYFEENSIEGTLYNEDGTEYKPAVKTITKTEVKKVEKPKPTTRQASLFDMIADTENKVTDQTDDHEPIDDVDDGEELNADYSPEELEELADEDSPTIEEIADKLQQALDEKNGVKREVEKPKQELPIFFVQYMDMKESHPDEIVLIRLGDFYEALDNDATILADELNLTLTGRAITADMRVPLVGFPYHAADVYIDKIRANHGVVIIESNGNIATLGKIVKTNGKTVDTSTGEILDDEPMDEPYSPSSFDKETMIYLYDLLDGKMDIA
ncbi:MAG: Cas9 inhibitor AcrIIA9 family protein [Clostridia bacterium]|nr:Cas9 inhibitor AcrIIA9 family protein [Clostridia bacterium]